MGELGPLRSTRAAETGQGRRLSLSGAEVAERSLLIRILTRITDRLLSLSARCTLVSNARYSSLQNGPGHTRLFVHVIWLPEGSPHCQRPSGRPDPLSTNLFHQEALEGRDRFRGAHVLRVAVYAYGLLF